MNRTDYRFSRSIDCLDIQQKQFIVTKARFFFVDVRLFGKFLIPVKEQVLYKLGVMDCVKS